MSDSSIVIIGGGPSGLFCALQVALDGIDLMVLEKNRVCGKKLLVSGSGQCNITHEGDIRSFLNHYGDNGIFLKPALMNFQNCDLINFFESHNVPLDVEPGGKIFPRSRKASDILDLLILECTARGVIIKSNYSVNSVSRDNTGFCIKTATDSVHSRILVIATGGETYPKTGSTGDGFRFARELGHSVAKTGPALTGVYIHEFNFSDLSGISFSDLSISLFQEGKKVRMHTGDLLFTHNGLSGPGILDLSRYIRPGDLLKISFIPGGDAQTVKERLIKEITVSGNKKLKTILQVLKLPDRFIRRLMDLSGVDPDLTGSHLSKKDRAVLIEMITACPFVVSRLGGLNEAMVTRGGVSLAEINPKTMESRLIPGLFFIGEVLDIDGDTGGYNLQAAFSTAVLTVKRIQALIKSS